MRLAALLLIATAVGCSATEDAAHDESNFASGKVSLTEFDFDAEVETTDATSKEATILGQLTYLVGTLYAESGNAQLYWAKVSNVTTKGTTIRYHVSVPVAWPKDPFPGLASKNAGIPEKYTLHLPRRVDEASLEKFFAKYGATCGAAENSEATTFWHDYNPKSSACTLADADVVVTDASVKPSSLNLSGKYPEYDKVHKDHLFKTVTIYGVDGEFTPTDDGALERQALHEKLKRELPGVTITEEPNDGHYLETTFRFDGPDGRVEITSFLVATVREAGAKFEQRYAAVSANADYVAFNGHSGYGKNIRALEAMGTVTPGQYQLFFFNGCNTLAYLDPTLLNRFKKANPDDPEGTRHLDILANALPQQFSVQTQTTIEVWRALRNKNAPKSFDELFDSNRNAFGPGETVVMGEEDNTYHP